MLTTKIKYFITVVILCMAWGIWVLSQPVEIIATHDGSVLLVKNFPMTDKGKIAWWENNKNSLKNEYNFPKPYSINGSFYISIFDFGQGYKVMPDTDQGSDLLCFDDIKAAEKCIEKKWLMDITFFNDKRTRFNLKGGSSYRQEIENGEIKRIR
ncbi:DUF943 family protein [Chimaeribacter arupi]|uniref:DUF943 domain-containing protein n=1 Tax=Chimaeribacter arupi TaxID=2060066 RepID=A0A2N5EHH7_9GAMM|nr:DUF943 family protein [Chimaeribacter arupi]PLR43337.1 hypothetical protein CYR34_20850 [Chimaeribacter arupi]